MGAESAPGELALGEVLLVGGGSALGKELLEGVSQPERWSAPGDASPMRGDLAPGVVLRAGKRLVEAIDGGETLRLSSLWGRGEGLTPYKVSEATDRRECECVCVVVGSNPQRPATETKWAWAQTK